MTPSQKGAQLLDRYYPSWYRYDRIDLDLLDMDSDGYCVLGQLFGSFYTGLRKLGLSEYGSDASNHGFIANPQGKQTWRGYKISSGLLKHQWINRIKERRLDPPIHYITPDQLGKEE